MEVIIRLFGQDPLFLEIAFIKLHVLNYTVTIDPPFMHIQGMVEEEIRQYPDREFRFLTLKKSDYSNLLKNKSKLRVIAEDIEGRTFYSNVLEFE